MIEELALVAETLANDGEPPAELRISLWSARPMADLFRASFSSVSRIWRKWNITPYRIETLKFSTVPQLEAKLRDVVGLYMSSPENAVVVSVDEKSPIQALEITRPDQPLSPGHASQCTHDYNRAGTSTPFAALDVLTGKLSADGRCQWHANAEFGDFLVQVAATHPDVELHVVCDNYAKPKHQNVKD